MNSQKPDLQAAMQGDAQAFERLISPHHHSLLAHCYRFTGSYFDAEDILQEVFLRAWRKLHTFAGRSSFRTWLYSIATHACLDFLRKEERRALPSEFYPPANPDAPFAEASPDAAWLEPLPDTVISREHLSPEARYARRESVRLALMIALQTLSPQQRAVWLLREVLGFSASEAAAILETTVSSINSALYRARAVLEGRVTLEASSAPVEESDFLLRYQQAWENADVDALVGLLKTEAQFVMPPSPSWYAGRAAIQRMLEKWLFAGEAAGRWRLFPTQANGQPAFVFYQRQPDGSGRFFGVHVLTLEGNRVAQITHFLQPGLERPFGFPAQQAL